MFFLNIVYFVVYINVDNKVHLQYILFHLHLLIEAIFLHFVQDIQATTATVTPQHL